MTSHRFVSFLGLFLLLCIPLQGLLAEEETEEPEYSMQINNWKLASLLTGGVNVTDYKDWQAGGSDTIALNARFELWAVRSDDNTEWRNRFRIEYGVSRTDDEDFRSSADTLQLESRFEYKLTRRLFVYMRGYLATHMGNQYDYFDDVEDIIFFDQEVEMQVKRTRIADGFDPINLEQGAGFGWTIFKTEDESTLVKFLAGAGTRQLLSDNYYIEDDNPITPELEYQHVTDYTDIGAEAVLDIIWTINDTAKLTTYGAAFYGFDEELWSGRWESALALQITDYIGVSLSAEMLYDEAVFDGEQWKLGSMLTFNYRVF